MAKDEILIDGKMFDIKAITFEPNAVVLYGHFDQKEDGLFAKSKDHESRKEGKLKSYKIPLLFVEDFKTPETLVYQPWKMNKYFIYSDSTLTVLPSADSPPPKFV